MMKKGIAGVLFLSVVALLAWPKVQPLLSGNATGEGARTGPRDRAPAVETVRLRAEPFETRLTFNGTLLADSAIDIKSELRGKIDRIAFTDGQEVAAGDLIVSIESGELEAELSSVREQLALAETNADRLGNLFASGSVTASERDDAVSRREVLKAQERQLAVRLQKTRLLAPFSGTLGLREVSLGDLIEPDTLITTLQTVKNLKVDFSVPERYQALLERDMPVSLWVAGYEEPFTAKVRAISPRVDINTRTIRVRADVANGERKLLPGNYARVELISRDDAALLVPSVAVLQSLEAVSVFRVQDGVAVRTDVKTGVRSEAQVQIRQGLQAGDVDDHLGDTKRSGRSACRYPQPGGGSWLMRLHELSIQRPVLAVVMSIVIIVFGVIGMRDLAIREFPLAERPIVSVQSSYPGANATVVENQITERLEEEINSVSGIRTMTAVSREGRSTVTVEFDLGDDIDRAANDVRDRVSAAVRRLPDNAEAPTVSKADADGDPIIFLNVRSDQRDLLALSGIADNLFKSRLETISGVGQVDIWGYKEYAMRLWLNPDALAAHGLTAIDVREAFRGANVELPTGRIEGDTIDLNIRTLSRLGADPEEFNQRVIKREDDRVVRFRDVGYAELGPLNERTVLRRNGVSMVGVVLRPQSGANQIAIADEFYRRLELIKRDLPADVDVAIGFDTSTFIRASITEVIQTLLIALMLVCATIFMFLREWRTTLIPIVTIPIALTGTFFVLYIAGFSINVLTLLGLVLAIGLVVDDAIVVVENIYKRIESGEAPRQAGIDGVREIFFAIIATTLSLVAVFTPLIFLGGLTGVLFREFGVTLAAAVVISSFVALTLAPMLCSRFLKNRARHPAFYRATEPMFQGMSEAYRRSLQGFLAHRWMAPAVLLSCLVVLVTIYRSLPEELAPLEDRDMLVIQAKGPQGAGYDYMYSAMSDVDAAISEAIPDALDATITVTSPGFGASTTTNSGFSRAILIPSAQRDRSQDELAGTVARALSEVASVQASVRQPQTINTGGSRGLPVQFVVQNTDIEKVRQIIPDFLAEARKHPAFSFVEVDMLFNQPELVLDIDRARADALGVDVAQIADVVQASLSGQRYGYFLREGEQFEIIGQLLRGARNDPRDVARLQVRAADGTLMPAENFVTMREQTSAPVLFRFNRFTAATFSANLADGVSLGDGIRAMQGIAADLLDDTYNTELSGQSREFADTGSSLLFVFILALLLIYLVLSAQFESFRDPLAIMLTVPMAITGGLIALWYFGQTLNIFSQIGLIMLIGLVTKNGILIVEFANQRRAAGLSIAEAVEDAAAARFRPILMTTLSTVLGTLPIALALGAGAQSRVPLGLAVIGGMLLGSFLSLYVVPAAYRAIASRAPMSEDEAVAGTVASPEAR